MEDASYEELYGPKIYYNPGFLWLIARHENGSGVNKCEKGARNTEVQKLISIAGNMNGLK